MASDAAALAGTAALAFVSTDVDNFLLTTAQFAVAPKERLRGIAVGQFLGFLTLVAASVATSAALHAVPTRWIGLLGLVPLVVGIRSLVQWRRGGPTAPGPGGRWPVAGGPFTAYLVTVGSGGDNLAVYVPLLRAAGGGGKALVVAVLLMGDLVLLLGARVLGRHPLALRTVERVGAAVTPFVYIVIGVVVLVRSGTLGSW